MLPNPGGWGWWVDTKGDIWHTSDTRGINRFRYGGVDKVGNPLYAYDNAQNYAMPAPFNVVKRAVYEADTDTMYLTGYTADEPFDRGYWKEVGRRLVRYDHWSKDTAAAIFDCVAVGYEEQAACDDDWVDG